MSRHANSFEMQCVAGQQHSEESFPDRWNKKKGGYRSAQEAVALQLSPLPRLFLGIKNRLTFLFISDR